LKSRTKSSILFTLIILVFVACGEKQGEDQSLRPEEYSNIGMPDPSRIWTYEDYENACVILDNLKTMCPYSLPRYRSARSGEYFSRIVEPENLSFVQDDTIPLHDRAYRIQEYMDIQGYLITIYTTMDTARQMYNSELIELYIFGITIAQNMLDLGQMINESVDENDMQMQYAFQSIQNMYIRTVLFVLENQSKANFFKEEDLARLSQFISESILLNEDWIVPEAMEEIKQRIRRIADDTSSERIRDAYVKLIEDK